MTHDKPLSVSDLEITDDLATKVGLVFATTLSRQIESIHYGLDDTGKEQVVAMALAVLQELLVAIEKQQQWTAYVDLEAMLKHGDTTYLVEAVDQLELAGIVTDTYMHGTDSFRMQPTEAFKTTLYLASLEGSSHPKNLRRAIAPAWIAAYQARKQRNESGGWA